MRGGHEYAKHVLTYWPITSFLTASVTTSNFLYYLLVFALSIVDLPENEK